MNYRALFQYLKEWFHILLKFLNLRLTSTLDKDLEIIAIRSQLALFNYEVETGKQSKPKATQAFRQLWVLLSNIMLTGKMVLSILSPKLLLGRFKKPQKERSPNYRPKNYCSHQRIHKENPLLSPKKIHGKLVLLNVKNIPAPNTIAKYFLITRKGKLHFRQGFIRPYYSSK